MQKITFNGAMDRAFHDELHGRVDAYFKERGISQKGDRRMALKVAVVLAVFVVLYASVLAAPALFIGLPLVALLPIVFLLGATLAQLGFNVGHDAIHGAASDKPWVNRLLAMSFDIAGASSYNWSHAHNFVHHTYTNIPGVDHDLEPGPWLLFKPTPKPAWPYRAQHIYAWFLYGFTTLVWLFKKDFVQILAPDPRTGKHAAFVDVLRVVRAKLLYAVFFVAVPLLVMDLTWWQFLLGSFVMHFATGASLAIVFQLAHCVEETAFPSPVNGKIERGFMAHQLMTTCNFAGNDPVVTFFTGGLNHQVEHHLFPKICHVHYAALAPIVKATAEKYGLPYLETPTFFGALRSHTRALVRFGRPQRAEVLAAISPAAAARAA